LIERGDLIDGTADLEGHLVVVVARGENLGGAGDGLTKLVVVLGVEGILRTGERHAVIWVTSQGVDILIDEADSTGEGDNCEQGEDGEMI
jgi:hypothetical protein